MVASNKKVFVFLEEKRVFKEMDREDPKLDWGWQHTPPGMVKLTLSKTRWEYAYVGNTKEEAAEKANHYTQEKIDKMEAELKRLKESLIKP